jgi:plastocyanin
MLQTTNEGEMNNNKKTKTNTTKAIIAAAAIMAVIASAAMILGIQTQMSQHALAQTQTNKTTATSESGYITMLTSNPVIVNPSQTTNKEFWINTVHLDGATSIHAAIANPNSAQNTPLHPAETPPANSTIPTGGGFRIVLPNNVGAWDFRSFTFAPDQIVVNQGDKVTLHFIGVLGVHHIITVDGVGTFALHRGEIHTVSFIATNPGTINFFCSVHLPNMAGEILVLPKPV